MGEEKKVNQIENPPSGVRPKKSGKPMTDPSNQSSPRTQPKVSPKPKTMRQKYKRKTSWFSLSWLSIFIPSKKVGTKTTSPQPKPPSSNSPKISHPPSPPKIKKPRIIRSKKPDSPLIHGIRLIIVALGIAGISGTFLSITDPSKKELLSTPKTATKQIKVAPPKPAIIEQSTVIKTINLGREINPLKTAIANSAQKYTKLQAGAFIYDPDNGNYVNFHGNQAFSAASTIKVPLLIAFFQDVDTGKIKLDEPLTLKKELMGSEAGTLQYQPIGKKIPAIEVATMMIIISDNTATNLIIDRLGGPEVVNQRFKEWGLNTTIVKNLLPDLEGTNLTSPQDLTNLMVLLHKGELVQPDSKEQILDIMRRTKTKTLLPKGIGSTAKIYHKTGDIGSSLGDVGLIETPSGKKYMIGILVKRPHNDYGAGELIRESSKITYQHFTKSNDQNNQAVPMTPSFTRPPTP